MHVWNVLHAARWKYRMQKNRHLGTMAQVCRAISSQLRHVSIIGKKNLLSSNIFPTCPHNMVVNFGPLVAEIISLVWGTPANVNGFRFFAALLHGTPVLGVSQTLRRWTEVATYIRQGGHHVGHCPTFLVYCHSLWLEGHRSCTKLASVILGGFWMSIPAWCTTPERKPPRQQVKTHVGY